MIKESVTLYFKDASSDKFYSVAIEDNNGVCSVPFTFGRTGTSGQSGSKVSGVDYVKAKKAYDAVVREKMGKGYTPGAGQATHAGIPAGAAKVLSGIYPQLLNVIDESEVEKYISDPAWGGQEKMDGKHLLLKKAVTTITAINKKGIECGFPVVYKKDLESLPLTNCLIDGEDVHDIYHLFDALEIAGQDLRGKTYLERYNFLGQFASKTIRVVYLAKTTAEKRALYERLKKEGREGIVFKRLDAKFSAGKAHADMVKFKFYAEASCLVTKVNDKNSIALGLYDGKKLIDVGNCTVQPAMRQKLLSLTNAVVEIKYLYAYKGGSLYQPSFKEIRDDIDTKECLLSQLKYKSEDSDE